MQAHLGQRLKNVRRIAQLDPVELEIGARREVAVALVIGAGHMRQAAQLRGIQRAIGDGDPQHIGVQLQIEAVHQPQGFELVLGDLAGQAALDLVAELPDPVGQEGLVDGVVLIHRCDPYLRLIRL